MWTTNDGSRTGRLYIFGGETLRPTFAEYPIPDPEEDPVMIGSHQSLWSYDISARRWQNEAAFRADAWALDGDEWGGGSIGEGAINMPASRSMFSVATVGAGKSKVGYRFFISCLMGNVPAAIV